MNELLDVKLGLTYNRLPDEEENTEADLSTTAILGMGVLGQMVLGKES